MKRDTIAVGIAYTAILSAFAYIVVQGVRVWPNLGWIALVILGLLLLGWIIRAYHRLGRIDLETSQAATEAAEQFLKVPPGEIVRERHQVHSRYFRVHRGELIEEDW